MVLDVSQGWSYAPDLPQIARLASRFKTIFANILGSGSADVIIWGNVQIWADVVMWSSAHISSDAISSAADWVRDGEWSISADSTAMGIGIAPGVSGAAVMDAFYSHPEALDRLEFWELTSPVIAFIVCLVERFWNSIPRDFVANAVNSVDTRPTPAARDMLIRAIRTEVISVNDILKEQIIANIEV